MSLVEDSKSRRSPWQEKGYKAGRTNVSIFNGDASRFKYHVWAPRDKATGYYKKFKAGQTVLNWCFSSSFRFPSQSAVQHSLNVTDDIFVSYRYIRALFKPEYDILDDIGQAPEKIPLFHKEVSPNFHPTGHRSTWDDELFQESVEDNTNRVTSAEVQEIVDNLTGKPLYPVRIMLIPFRDKKGNLIFGALEKNYSFVKTTILRSWKADAVTKFADGNSYMTRNESFIFETEFVLKVEAQAGEKLRHKDPEALIESFVTTITKNQKQVQKVKVLGKGEPVNTALYVLLSKDPFGIYSTFIAKKSVIQYMGHLAKREPREGTKIAVSPVRSFPASPSLADFTGRMKAFVENKGIDNDEKAALIEISNAKKREAYIQVEAEADPNSDDGAMEEETVDANTDDKDTPTDLIADLASWTTESIWTLSPQGIGKAKGQKRGKQQVAIMGYSAGMLAEQVLDWKVGGSQQGKATRMDNGIYAAEWLHLSAFSLGGVPLATNTDQGPQAAQVATNLVFGSSEANSMMTRYEKAWRTLIKDEFNLLDNHGFSANLTIETNAANTDILLDSSSGTDSYTWDSKKISDYAGGDLETVAKKYQFFAYSIAWTVNCNLASRCLGKQQPSRSTNFYPFSRRFFHKVEDSLDSQIYGHMIKCAIGEVSTDINTFKGKMMKKFPSMKDSELVAAVSTYAPKFLQPPDLNGKRQGYFDGCVDGLNDYANDEKNKGKGKKGLIRKQLNK